MAAIEMSFEEAFEKLESTVRQLEVGDLTIEEAVSLYEQGMQLARLCQQRLDAAELRISKLLAVAPGEYEVVPLDGSS